MIQLKKLNAILIGAGALSLSSLAFASGFQLWEQDGASIGNYHAGYAASAEDASTGFYNPAGLTRIKKPQLVLAADLITPHFDYTGTASATLLGPRTDFVRANGGTHNLVPSFHFAYPINDRITAALSAVGPFGLKTVYGRDTFLRTNTVYSSLSVIDISPEVGFKIHPQFSLGAGLDIERAHAEFASSAYLAALTPFYLDSVNRADGATAYGFHIGGLYEYDDQTRFGLSYHSKVTHHFSGDSTLTGLIIPLINNGNPEYVTNLAKTKITTPAYTAFSGYHHTQGKWAYMGSVIYTQWSVLKNITLQNVGSLGGGGLGFTNVVVPQNWHDTWNVSGGVGYDLNEAITLRAGLGYDQSPVPEGYRNLILPDNDRYVTALGVSYHPNKTITLDLGWSHYFVKDARITPPPLALGSQTSTTNGKSKNSGDVFGAQITWNFA